MWQIVLFIKYSLSSRNMGMAFAHSVKVVVEYGSDCSQRQEAYDLSDLELLCTIRITCVTRLSRQLLQSPPTFLLRDFNPRPVWQHNNRPFSPLTPHTRVHINTTTPHNSYLKPTTTPHAFETSSTLQPRSRTRRQDPNHSPPSSNPIRHRLSLMALHQHLQNSGASTEVSINLHRGMVGKQIGQRAARQHLLQMFQTFFAVLQAGVEAD